MRLSPRHHPYTRLHGFPRVPNILLLLLKLRGWKEVRGGSRRTPDYAAGHVSLICKGSLNEWSPPKAHWFKWSSKHRARKKTIRSKLDKVMRGETKDGVNEKMERYERRNVDLSCPCATPLWGSGVFAWLTRGALGYIRVCVGRGTPHLQCCYWKLVEFHGYGLEFPPKIDLRRVLKDLWLPNDISTALSDPIPQSSACHRFFFRATSRVLLPMIRSSSSE